MLGVIVGVIVFVGVGVGVSLTVGVGVGVSLIVGVTLGVGVGDGVIALLCDSLIRSIKLSTTVFISLNVTSTPLSLLNNVLIAKTLYAPFPPVV